MRVLVACEFSGAVRDAFAARGHFAISCDLAASELPGRHVRGDVRPLLAKRWDLIVAFPPCTYLARSGARWNKVQPGRDALTAEALDFVRALMDAPCPRIAIENPIGRISSAIRRPDQIIQPWQFGHGETKATCLWLKGLPKLVPTNVVEGRSNRVHFFPDSKRRTVERSRTYSGVAAAMAEQWGLSPRWTS